MPRPIHIGLGLAAALAVAASCGSKDSGLAPGNASGNSSSGSGGTGTGSSTGGVNQSGNTGGGINIVGSGGATGAGGDTGEGGGCLTESHLGSLKPLDIVLVLDRSSSMKGPLWNGAVKAVSDFIGDPNVKATSLGIDFLPPQKALNECDVAAYNPLQVPLAALPAGQAALLKSIQTATPEGANTPTYSALYGALQFANDYQDTHPDHKVVVMLASDGDPTSCDTDIDDIAAIVKTAYQYNGVLTFIAAVQGANLVKLDPIAAAGGTGKAIDITMDISQLKQALDKIRLDVLACEYAIPKPMGQAFDPTKLNITYTPGGGSGMTVGQQKNAAACGNNPGWYYDNNAKPTKIFFCPATCAAAKKDANAQVDFVFGCPTVVGNPG